MDRAAPYERTTVMREELIFTQVGLTAQEHANIMNALGAWQEKSDWIREAVQERLKGGQKGQRVQRRSTHEQKQLILELFDSPDRIVTYSEICETRPKGTTAVARALKQLVEEKKIKRVRRGEYQRA